MFYYLFRQSWILYYQQNLNHSKPTNLYFDLIEVDFAGVFNCNDSERVGEVCNGLATRSGTYDSQKAEIFATV